MKRSVMALFACLAFAATGFAQQGAADAPASVEDIERYMKVVHSPDTMRETLEAMKKPFHQMIHQQIAGTPNLPPDTETRELKEFDDMVSSFPIDEMLQAVAPIYQKHFTKRDVDALVAFYSTPTGQKLLREQPAIAAEGMQAMMPIVQKMTARAIEKVQDEIAQMQKENEAKSKKPPQPAQN